MLIWSRLEHEFDWDLCTSYSTVYLIVFEITNLVRWKPLFIHDQGYIRIIITKIIRIFIKNRGLGTAVYAGSKRYLIAWKTAKSDKNKDNFRTIFW